MFIIDLQMDTLPPFSLFLVRILLMYSVFHTKSLRTILSIFWPNKISNDDLLRQCHQDIIGTILRRRRWKWIGHLIRRDRNSITRTALHWTPEGRRKRGRLKHTRRRNVDGELKTMNNTRRTVEKITKDRQKWGTFGAAQWHTGR